MVFDKEFKDAVLNLPIKEKDRLLLRLLKKDLPLVDKLHFELVSDVSVDEARGKIEKQIINKMEVLKTYDFQPGWFMMELRYLSGDITYHQKKTNDKFGEASLNLLLLNEFLERFNCNIHQVRTKKFYKLGIYLINKVFKMLISIQALHEDCFLDFEDNLELLGSQLSKNKHLMQLGVNNGFDINWLFQGVIPEDINKIHKEIREQGFLK